MEEQQETRCSKSSLPISQLEFQPLSLGNLRLQAQTSLKFSSTSRTRWELVLLLTS